MKIYILAFLHFFIFASLDMMQQITMRGLQMSFFLDLVSDNGTQVEEGDNGTLSTLSTLLMVAARNGLTDVVDELLNLNATNTLSRDSILLIQVNYCLIWEALYLITTGFMKTVPLVYSLFSVFIQKII